MMRKLILKICVSGLMLWLSVISSESAFSYGSVSKIYKHHNDNYNALASKNIENEIIYQIVVDRFANGNSNNDCVYGGKFCKNNTQEDWFRYQGGDIRGIIQKLPYIKELGVTRLWMTPIFENQQVTVEALKFGNWVNITSYHGYWIKDWFRLNPFFTDNGTQDYDIVNELITKSLPDMRIYLDTVVNHSSPIIASKWSLDSLQSESPLEYPKTHRGTVYRDGQYFISHDDDVQRFKKGETPMFHHNPNKIGEPLSCDDQWNNPYIVQTCNLQGLTDFNQDHPDVDKYFKDAHMFWLNKFPDLAGYRMDTIKHVKNEYWRKFSDYIYSFPQNTSNLEIFGEYYGGRAADAVAGDFYTNTRMSMYDFQFRYVVEDVFLRNGHFKAFSEMWSQDPWLTDARYLITYLDSHDQVRLRSIGMTEKRMRQAIALWLVSRGVPCIYYGLEQDLFEPNGNPYDPDPFNRPMMKSFDTQAPFYKLIKKLNDLRKSNSAIRYGLTHVVHETDNIFAFERVDGDNMVFFATSKNPVQGGDHFEVENLMLPAGSYVDLLTGKGYLVEDGKVRVNLKDGDIVILSTNYNHFID